MVLNNLNSTPGEYLYALWGGLFSASRQSHFLEMISAQFLLTSALLALALPTFSTPLSKPSVRATCDYKVDISNPLLPFLDYPAFRAAASDAVAALEEFSVTGRAPAKQGDALTCDRIRVRKEWRQLTYDEKKAYIQAEKCLMRAPNYGLTANETFSLHDGLTGVSLYRLA